MGGKTCGAEVIGADRAELEPSLRARSIPQALAIRPRHARQRGGKVSPRWQRGLGNSTHLVLVATAFSCEPEFYARRPDIVRLYLAPPEQALVLCVGEKSQIQALNRTQPALPMWLGLPACTTHDDYVCHGTTSLFAALNVVSRNIYGRRFRRHRHIEFIAFLNPPARSYLGRERHLICDSYGIREHPAVKQWLAAHPASISTSLRPTPRGSTSSGAASRTSGAPSVASRATGAKTPDPSVGPNLPVKSNVAFATLHLYARHQTR